MTPDQKFARWMNLSMYIFIVVFAYFLLADSIIPLTQQAMVSRVVTKIVPRVDGHVISIRVKNNQAVNKGDVLFQIDPTPFRIMVDRATLNLEKTKKISAQSVSISAQANLNIATARLKELQASQGQLDTSNINLGVALNKLEQARLELSSTQVKAVHDGIVTNLQFEAGAYATSGKPLLALVSNHIDIIADFREKSSRNVSIGRRVLVAFDREPGQVYPAHVTSIDAGVSVGQFEADGSLAKPTKSDRWVRDAQRMRMHLTLDVPYPISLPSGARATVQILPKSHFFSWLACTQIYLLSLLHYIY